MKQQTSKPTLAHHRAKIQRLGHSGGVDPMNRNTNKVMRSIRRSVNRKYTRVNNSMHLLPDRTATEPTGLPGITGCQPSLFLINSMNLFDDLKSDLGLGRLGRVVGLCVRMFLLIG
ncbi:unnamed protein product [Ilex paraguariensis]|uniref:Uncharacterized protein n=1 Tax=Ilex paraguariensis TaxID=185542 RepID=A0ABC8UH58_9AQUA